MSYRVETTSTFDKQFKKLDANTKKTIKKWMVKNIVNCENPREHGKALKSNRSGQWRYRIGNYRLLCKIKDKDLIILALTIRHRSSIYNS